MVPGPARRVGSLPRKFTYYNERGRLVPVLLTGMKRGNLDLPGGQFLSRNRYEERCREVLKADLFSGFS